MNTPMAFAMFIRMLKARDAQEFLFETSRCHGGFFHRFISLERTFEQWIMLSFVWSNTGKGFAYWTQFADDYIRYFKKLNEDTTENKQPNSDILG